MKPWVSVDAGDDSVCILFIITFFSLNNSERTAPRGGGKLALPWHLGVTKPAACLLSRSLCDVAEMDHRPRSTDHGHLGAYSIHIFEFDGITTATQQDVA